MAGALAYNIAVGGSSANPPTIAHREFAKALLGCDHFDRVLWYPCGTRHDKLYGVDPQHRANMSRATFADVQKAVLKGDRIPQFDLRMNDVFGENTRTLDRVEEVALEFRGAHVYWFTGIDVLVPQDKYEGLCEVEWLWSGGRDLLREWPVAIVPRAGVSESITLTLHPDSIIIPANLPDCSSTEVRRRIQADEPFEHLVVPHVADYIKQHRLYGFGSRAVQSVHQEGR